MRAARWLIVIALAAMSSPFVALLVWASRYPYHDLTRTAAVDIGAVGIFLFALPAVILAGRQLNREGRRTDAARQVVNLRPSRTTSHDH